MNKKDAHSFCKNSASESWGDGVAFAAAGLISFVELGYLDWKIDDPDICPLDLYSVPFPPNPGLTPDEYSDELGWCDGAGCWLFDPSSSTGLSESELLPPFLPHLDFWVENYIK